MRGSQFDLADNQACLRSIHGFGHRAHQSHTKCSGPSSFLHDIISRIAGLKLCPPTAPAGCLTEKPSGGRRNCLTRRSTRGEKGPVLTSKGNPVQLCLPPNSTIQFHHAWLAQRLRIFSQIQWLKCDYFGKTKIIGIRQPQDATSDFRSVCSRPRRNPLRHFRI